VTAFGPELKETVVCRVIVFIGYVYRLSGMAVRLHVLPGRPGAVYSTPLHNSRRVVLLSCFLASRYALSLLLCFAEAVMCNTGRTQ